MISYKQWKLLHENLDADAVIGISRPASLGIAGEALSLYGMMTKKMNGKVPPDLDKLKDMGGADDAAPHDDLDADHDDEDMDDMDHDEEGEEGDEGDEDMDDMGHDDETGDKDVIKKKRPMPDMGGAPGALGAPGMAGAAPSMMNYMKKEHDDKDMDDEVDEKDVEDMGDEKDADMDEKPTCCPKCSKMKKSGKKKCCKMTKEEKEFYESLRRQLGGVKFTRDQLGFWVPVKEDVLISNEPKAETEPTSTEPAPGEVGFAPQQKVGGGVIGSTFQEWVSKYNTATKKKKK